MKEFEVTVKVFNNRLRERRAQLQMSQADVATHVGITPSMYSAYECLNVSPVDKHHYWKDAVHRMADFYKTTPEELFPQAIKEIKQSRATRKINRSELELMLSTHHRRMLEMPDAALERNEQLDELKQGMRVLSSREKEVLKMRHELGQTYEEIANELGITRERVRQIEHRSYYKVKVKLMGK